MNYNLNHSFSTFSVLDLDSVSLLKRLFSSSELIDSTPLEFEHFALCIDILTPSEYFSPSFAIYCDIHLFFTFVNAALIWQGNENLSVVVLN